MKETIDQIKELLKDRNYEMTPDINKLLTCLVEDLDRETDELANTIEDMINANEILTNHKVVEYVQFITGLPKNDIFDHYGKFKLNQAIENQLQFEMN